MEAPRVYQRDLNDLNRGPEQEQNDALDLNDEEIEQEYIYQIPEGKALFPSQASLPLTCYRIDRKLGIFSTCMIIVNRMIGTGIFSTPSSILQATNSTGAALLFWVLGGVMSLW
jgi:hypothetical protein